MKYFVHADSRFRGVTKIQTKQTENQRIKTIIIEEFKGNNLQQLNYRMAPPKEKRPEKGVSFPVTGNGDRSTSILGKNVIAAALRGAGTPEGNSFAEKCEKEKNWRFKYQNHFSNMVKVSASR